MRRIGHRGAMGHAPENTIASFEKALALGCDEVETDVWLAEDGGLIVAHDRPRGDGGGLPLAEVLDFCRGRMGVNVELKCAESEENALRTGAAVGRFIAERRDSDVYVSSFWWDALNAARDAAPGVRRAFLFSASPERPALLRGAKSLELWALHPNRAYVTSTLVTAAHRAGLAVNVWTVNDPQEIGKLVALGVDGIMSDYPERIPKNA